MIIFFLLFIVLPLIVLGVLSAALLAVFTHFAISMQAKRLGKSQSLNEQQMREKAVVQVVWTYIILIGCFLLFLVVRYFAT